MAKIIITIQDEMPVNGQNGVTISYEGDLEPQVDILPLLKQGEDVKIDQVIL